MTDASQAIPYESRTSKQPFRTGRSEREPQMTATVGIGAERIPGHGVDEALSWLAHGMQHVQENHPRSSEVPGPCPSPPLIPPGSPPRSCSRSDAAARVRSSCTASPARGPEHAGDRSGSRPSTRPSTATSAGQALSDLSQPFDPAEPDLALRARRAQAAAVAEIIQRARPEVLLINEFDYSTAR